MKYRVFMILTLLSMLVSVAPLAAQDTPEEFPLTIVDGTANTLSFDNPPERIICLYTRCMELLAALEFAPVGTMVSAEMFTTNPAYFPQPNEIALIDWDGDNPNMEQLIALQPDLVLGWQEVQAPLEGIAPVYNVVNEQDTYQESHDEIRAFARLLGREDIAEANITVALNRLEAYKRLSHGDVSIMDMFFSNEASYYRDGQSGTCNLLKEVAICDWPDPQNSATWSVEANDEALLQLDPDVILISSYGFEGMTAEEIQATLSERPLWAELSAMKSGRIYVEPDGLNLDGMGTVGMNLMLNYFMPLLYPDVFPEPLTDEQVAEILASEASTTPSEIISFVDSTGATITLDSVPERIICLYHACLEYVAALGIEPIALPESYWVAQFADNPTYFNQPNNIQRLAMPEGSPDFEQMASLQPDIVFGWPELRESLEGIAPLHDIGATGNDYQSTLRELREFAAILGKSDVAEVVIQRFEDRLAAYRLLSPRNLTVLQTGGDGEAFWISTENSVPCSLLNEVAICEWEDPNPRPGIWGYMANIEAVLDLNPDVIIFESWVDGLTSAEISTQLTESNPLWGELSAVQAGHIFDDSGRDSYGIGTIGGTRLLDTFMPLIYPDVFPEPLTDEQVAEILAD